MAASSQFASRGSTENEDMSEMMMLEEFKRNVIQHEREPLIQRRTWWKNTPKSSTYRGKVKVMPAITDRIASGIILEESDAGPGGRWESYVQSEYQRENEGIEASPAVWFSRRLRREMTESRYGGTTVYQGNFGILVGRNLPPVSSDSSSDEESSVPLSQGSQHSPGVEEGHFEHHLGNENDPGELQVIFEDPANASPMDLDDSDETDDSDDSDDSEEDDEFRAEEETVRMAKLFEDFPTMAKALGPIDILDETYGVLAVTQDPDWKILDASQLGHRVRTWLAQFTCK